MNTDLNMMKKYLVKNIRCMINNGMYRKDSPDEEINATTITAAIKQMCLMLGVVDEIDRTEIANGVYARLRKDGYIAKIRRMYK